MIRPKRRSGLTRPFKRLLMVPCFLLLVTCSRDAPQNFLKPVGSIAKEQHSLWNLTFAIATVIFFLVEGILLFAIFRYRQKSPKDSPKQVHGNNRLEVAWTAIPAFLLAGIAVPTIGMIFDQAAPPKGNPIEVTVIARQWWWQYEYADPKLITANELHIPIGRPVVLSMRSDDVIHSFWVPKLAGKQDVVPGRVNKLTIRAEEPGEYLGQCMEYCGLSHANMRLRVIAESQADYDRWVDEQMAAASPPTDALAAKGQQIFLTGTWPNGSCSGCHAVNGTDAQGAVGPNLTHFASRETFAGAMFPRNDDQLRAWLKDPPARKPGSKMPRLGLSDEEIDALVAYLNSLE